MNRLGEYLAQVLRDIPMTQAELALRTGRSVFTINRIIAGKTGISADTALLLERALGIKAAHWLRLQTDDRLADHRQRLTGGQSQPTKV